MLQIKRTELNEMDYDDLIELIIKNDLNSNELVSEDVMKDYIIEAVNDDYYTLASHLIEAMTGAQYYFYDRSMGTLEDPTPLEDEDDIISYLEDYYIEIIEDEED